MGLVMDKHDESGFVERDATTSESLFVQATRDHAFPIVASAIILQVIGCDLASEPTLLSSKSPWNSDPS